MNAQKLSKRLAMVASYVPQDEVVADIGSDHAYLPCYLVHNGIAKQAIAGEVVEGPYQSARQEVKHEQLQEKITVRLADGMDAVEKEDGVTVVTIAGMGGPLIASILNKDLSRLETVERLVLQPNIHAISIRQWAQHHGWAIIDEEILEEDDKIYEVLVLERGSQTLSDAEMLVGPHLMIKKTAVFVAKWTREITQWQQILSSIEKADHTAAIDLKKKELSQKITLVKEVL